MRYLNFIAKESVWRANFFQLQPKVTFSRESTRSRVDSWVFLPRLELACVRVPAKSDQSVRSQTRLRLALEMAQPSTEISEEPF
jgi:hypothetical protein